MSLYLSYNIDTKNEKILAVNWSNTDIPVLAISTDKNKITFFQDEGLNISEHDILKDAKVSALAWHPTEMILAYGYIDGRVGIWIDEENFNKEEKSIHDSKIKIIKFNSAGNRLVSADERGSICVWRFENSLFKLCVYKQNYQIEEIFFPRFFFEKHEQNAKFPSQDKLNTLFFFCNSGGMLFLADDSNSSPEICRVGGKIKSLLFYEKDNSIILITSHMLLVKCRIYFNQQLTPKKIKLSIAGNPENIKTVWAGLGLLAMVSGDDLIRFFYVETEQAYFLSMSDHDVGKIFVEDTFSCIDYSFRKRILIAGSTKGKVYMWKCNLTSTIIPISSESWEPYCIVDTIPNILDMKWSSYMGLVLVVNKNNVHAMLSETILQKKMNSKLKVIQISHKTLEIIADNGTGIIEQNNVKRVETGETIKGLDLYKNTLLTWNGTNAFVYEINNLNLSKLNSLNIKSNLLALNEDSIIVGNGKNIDVLSFEGETKSKVSIDAIYGEVSQFNVNDKFLLIITSNQYFAIFDISRRTLKQTMNYRKFEKNKQNLGEIREGSVNCKGSHIGILCDSLANQEIRIPETVFYVYDVELDSFTDHEISPNRIPIEFIWDFSDTRLFGIQTEYAKDLSEENFSNVNEEKKKKEWYGSEFFVFFYTNEYGIKMQESHKINREIQGIFSLCIPSIYFIISTSSENKLHSLMEKKFQFFQGLEKVDDNIKTSLIDFSILMSSGKLDEAYKIVKNIKNPSIWENMAIICIKTKRLDVLEICLSNMRFSRGIKALRESKNEKEPEAKLAIVAMHLGLIEEAKVLLQECSRFDLLIKFNISIGDYEKAIDISSINERISLKNSYYRIAQNYEKSNEIESAIDYYKLSGTHHREIPRMLIQKNKMSILEEFINKETDPDFFRWWASYCERNDNIDQAIAYYKKANDYTNIVRILISTNNMEEARRICNETKDPGACFLLGRAMEDNNENKEAIYYYGMSMRINQAFRLAKEHNMDSEIYNLGLQAPQLAKNTIAEYFERKNDHIKAAKLYQLSGNIKSALNICLVSQQYDLIREIADNVEYKNDPETLKSLAEYFVDQGHDDKALGTYIRLKDYDTALKLCEAKNLKISPETADAIFDELDIKTENEAKKKLLKKLAKQLTIQGDFELAHQKYVQMGNLKKAMKCLIKLGDKDKVIYFANTSRNPDNYILAANFLQSLDWNDNHDIVKLIITFLKKAKAYDNLSNFYILCAGVEINEYRNYEKALEAFNEAKLVLKQELGKEMIEEEKQKVKSKDEELEKKITLTKVFLHTCSIKKNQAQESLKQCTELLSIPGIDNIVREGDIYNIMIELYWDEKEYDNAYHVLEVMKARKKMLSNYIDPKDIAKICEAVGKSNTFINDNKNYISNHDIEDEEIV